MTVTGTDGVCIRAKAHLVLASGDIPGVAALCHHKGHNSKFGCRICLIEGVRLQSPGGTMAGHAEYFPGANNSCTDMVVRSKRAFQHGDIVSLVTRNRRTQSNMYCYANRLVASRNKHRLRPFAHFMAHSSLASMRCTCLGVTSRGKYADCWLPKRPRQCTWERHVRKLSGRRQKEQGTFCHRHLKVE